MDSDASGTDFEFPSDAAGVAALFAVDPAGLGGVILRACAGPARDAWVASLVALLPAGTPSRRVPLHIGDERLLGGLDLAATLRAGYVVAERGLLASADGGVLWLAMAERLRPAAAAHIASVLDTGALCTERDGVAMSSASRVGVVALDEGLGDDEAAPLRLRERLAFWLVLEPVAKDGKADAGFDRQRVAAARARLPSVTAGHDIVEALCAAALALGVDSVRAPLLALRAAKGAAALAGRDQVDARDAALAARLVLAPRATRLPVDEAAEDAVDVPPDADPPPPDDTAPAPDPALAHASEPPPGADVGPDADPDPGADPPAAPPAPGEPIDDVVLEAALAAIPPHLLDALKLSTAAGARPLSAGRAGTLKAQALRGRPSGVRRGEPRGGARLNLIETLRAAAPWQALRRREADAAGRAPTRIQVRSEDFHVTRYRQRTETTTVFVVDASGSAALHRLAEAKGAVELLLADCYVRRDSVALIAFRGRIAELLLPPTRSLARAKRSLAGLPGGGGTPLAAAIDAAAQLGDAVRRRGATPVVVLLTDGRANIALDGSPGRANATRDALAAARRLRGAGFAALLMDTSTLPQEPARLLADAMGATYLPLPHAAAPALSRAVRDASRQQAGSRRAGPDNR